MQQTNAIKISSAYQKTGSYGKRRKRWSIEKITDRRTSVMRSIAPQHLKRAKPDRLENLVIKNATTPATVLKILSIPHYPSI
ncbi:hypothetical protein [Bartonella vinsonii]|uniref:hypothetical protein n=1 Tax=Bartonella vinsonii TaxID=33047 RepID=UPI0005549442|nr:hypothetical protein [Bartonella vinsonii]